MNWGKGLVAGLSLFMLFIIGLVVCMFAAPADEYDHHYYEKGLNFDADYKQERQVVIDHATPIIEQQTDHLIIKFIEPAKGTIRFIRPANQRLDANFALESDLENQAITSTAQIAKGKWQLLLTWRSNNKDYRYQQDIYLK